jgi:hypothetical protein
MSNGIPRGKVPKETMNTDSNNQPTTPLQQKRPTFVWVIFFFYWIGLFITIAVWILGIIAKSKGMHLPPVDTVDLVCGYFGLGLRGVATLRLFYLKKDAWLWFASAVAIMITLKIMSCISAFMLDKPMFTLIYTSVFATAFWTYVTWYSYKICNKDTPQSQSP